MVMSDKHTKYPTVSLTSDGLLLNEHLRDPVDSLAVVADLLHSDLVRLNADLLDRVVDPVLEVLRHGVTCHHAHDDVTAHRGRVHQAPWADVGHAEVDDHLASHVGDLQGSE